MVYLETKEEANIAIQGLNETIRYIAKEYEPKNKGKILAATIKLTQLQQKKKN